MHFCENLYQSTAIVPIIDPFHRLNCCGNTIVHFEANTPGIGSMGKAVTHTKHHTMASSFMAHRKCFSSTLILGMFNFCASSTDNTCLSSLESSWSFWSKPGEMVRKSTPAKPWPYCTYRLFKLAQIVTKVVVTRKHTHLDFVSVTEGCAHDNSVVAVLLVVVVNLGDAHDTCVFNTSAKNIKTF